MSKKVLKSLPGELSKIQYEVLIGGLLGDTHLSCRDKNPHIQINRQRRDLKYLTWQFNIFKDFCTERGITHSDVFDKRTNKSYPSSRFRTRNCEILMPIYNDWYVNKKKIVPKNFEFTPLILAIWFADDGKISSIGRNELRLVLATNGFKHEEVFYLADKLSKYLKSTFRVCRQKSEQYTIEGSSDSTYEFIKCISKDFDLFGLDRKNKWKNKDLTFNVKNKRSRRYYDLAPIVLSLDSLYSNDLIKPGLYTENTADEVLRNFYKKEYFTRIKEGLKFKYTLTNLGRDYFQSLLNETELKIDIK